MENTEPKAARINLNCLEAELGMQEGTFRRVLAVLQISKTETAKTVFHRLMPQAKLIDMKLQQLRGVGIDLDELTQPIDAIFGLVLDLYAVPSPDDFDRGGAYQIFDHFLSDKPTLDECYQEFQSYLTKLHGQVEEPSSSH